MSEFERTPEERLTAMDPFAGAPYAHGDSPAMLSRITATPRVAKVSFAQGFRVRMAGAVAVAALVSVGGIAAINAAGPSLQVLALSTTNHSGALPKADSSTTTPALGDMRLAENFQFVAGPDLTSGTGTAPSYVLSAPGDFAAASQQIASDLGVSGTPSDTPAANSYWTIGDTTSAYVSFWTDNAELSWNYTNVDLANNATLSSPPATTTPVDGLDPGTLTPTTSSTTTGLDNAGALADAQSTLSQLGVTGNFGDPSYSTDGPYDNGQVWNEVTLPWQVGSTDTGISFDFTFDPTGTLVYADGVDVVVSPGDTYPLISEVDAVTALQNQQNSDVTPGGPILYTPITSPTDVANGSSSGTSSGSSGTPSGTSGDSTSTTIGAGTTPVSVPPTDGGTGTGDGSTTTTTPSDTLPTVTVTLDSASIQYSLYTLSDGAEVLLPQYVFTADDGSTWTVLAVDPSYVSLSTNSGGVTPLVY
jgi:hypothetical protein